MLFFVLSATELLVMLFSPIDMLLNILPKTRILLTEESYEKRKEITERYFEICKLATDPLRFEILLKL